MAVEESGGFFAVVVPGDNIPYTGSNGMDLNPDFGLGEEVPSGPTPPTELLRKAVSPGQTDGFLLRVEVVTGFVVSAGDPLVQFHAVLSDVGITQSVVNSVNLVIVGSSHSRISTVGSVIVPGYQVVDLAKGNFFYIRINPWTSPMGVGTAGAAIIGKDLRYLGLMIQVPNHAAGVFFSAGVVDAKIVQQSDVWQDPSDFIYPSAVSVK